MSDRLAVILKVILSAEEREQAALELCEDSLAEGRPWGDGDGWSDGYAGGYGDGYGDGCGDGYGWSYGYADGDGESTSDV